MVVVVGYTTLNSEGRTEIVVHQEYDSKQEAIEGAEAFAQASVDNQEIIEVLRGQRISDTQVDYNVIHEIPR
jgi:fructose-1,6-bisphosphatase